MNRRDFLFSFAKKTVGKNQSADPFLPFISDISLLKTICLSCDAPCLNACQEHIIVLNKGMPVLNFKENGCTFCKECAKACDKNVLNEHLPPKIDISVAINTKECLAWKNTMCFACKDICQTKAISFFGMFKPVINHDPCTGCGICIGLCPANAIFVKTTNYKEVT